MQTPCLHLSDLTKCYPARHGTFVAVEGVNLQIQEGEFVTLMGHSGCGKSTLLNLVAGLTKATRGGVALDGREVKSPGPERMVVFQNYSLLPWFTVTQNVRLAVDPVFPALPRREREARSRRFVELVGLDRAADQLPSELSGGMKQRASIARALAVNPRVLLLDEPFGALDALTREDMQNELLRIWEDNRTTVLMITHDVDEAILLSDRVVMMTGGPAATIGASFHVPLKRPRDRNSLTEDPAYYRLRNEILSFLYGDDAEAELHPASPAVRSRDATEQTGSTSPRTSAATSAV